MVPCYDQCMMLTLHDYQVKSNITHIVHNAWRVDFNLSVTSFEKYIAGTRRLVDLCCLLERPVKLLYTSSVAATQTWGLNRGRVPEEVITDPRVAMGNGYAASKFATENVSHLSVNCTEISPTTIDIISSLGKQPIMALSAHRFA